METHPRSADSEPIVYPDSDGKPMAENTLQYEWIVTIQGNLDAIRTEDFVGGDLLWYPVQGHPEIRMAPDALVAIGRPKGHRGSYRTWEEGGVAPQVVFEVWSPGNSAPEAIEKHDFYERYGALEFYLYDPDRHELAGWVRENADQPLLRIANMNGWTSPQLQIRFTFQSRRLVIYGPDGSHFRTFAEILRDAHEERQRAETEKARADAEQRRADEAKQRADEAKQRADEAKQRADEAESRAQADRDRADALAARLKALGIEP